MKKIVKKILYPLIPNFLLDWAKGKKQNIEVRNWRKNGCPSPPPHLVKQNIIKDYQKKLGMKILIETGTFTGAMVEAQKNNFDQVVSIELAHELFLKAQKRFANDKNVRIVEGDSGKVLPEVVKDINEPAIFWLDGHYSAGETAMGDLECPIYEEVDSIFEKADFDHLLLIDDARLFVGERDYPTIDDLTKYVKSKKPNYEVSVEHDIIRYQAKAN